MGLDNFRQIDRFEAKIAQTRRMIRITFDSSHRTTANFCQQTAADAAIGTVRFFPALAAVRLYRFHVVRDPLGIESKCDSALASACLRLSTYSSRARSLR